MNLWLQLALNFVVLQTLIFETHPLDDGANSAEQFSTKLWPKWRTAPRTNGRRKANNAKFKNATFKRVKFEGTDLHTDNGDKLVEKGTIKTEANEDDDDDDASTPQWNKMSTDLVIKEEPYDSGDANDGDNDSDEAGDEKEDGQDDNNLPSDDSHGGLINESDEEIYKKLKEYKKIKRSNPKLSDAIISKRHFGVNQRTLYKWKTKFGYEKRRHCHEDVLKIMKLYRRVKEMNANFTDAEFADKIGISIVTLIKWKNKLGMEKGHPFYSEEQIQKLLKKYSKIKTKAPNISDARIAEQMDINRRTLRLWKKKYGFKQKLQMVYTPQEKYRAIQQYEKALVEHGDAAPHDYEIAKKLKICRGTLRKWKREFGIKSRKGYSEEEKMEILGKYCKLKKQKREQSETNIAKQLQINRRTLKRWTSEFGTRKQSQKSSAVQDKAAQQAAQGGGDEHIVDNEEH